MSREETDGIAKKAFDDAIRQAVEVAKLYEPAGYFAIGNDTDGEPAKLIAHHISALKWKSKPE